MALSRQIFPALILMLPFSVQAEFEMNFTPSSPASSMTVCPQRLGGACVGVPGSQTPFLTSTELDADVQLPEIVEEDGIQYYHLIVGDPANGFAQEVYIQIGFAEDGFSTFGGIGGGPLVMGSASTGDRSADDGLSGGNGSDPLNINDTISTGNGSADPRKVIMRQIVSDGEITMEFLKDQFDRKPVIAQTLNSADITSTVIIDMRNSTYDDMNTPGTMINTMSLQGADIPGGSASFNMTNDAQNSVVDAGRYTYTPGSGPGESDGTYNYLNANAIDMDDIPWETYFDPDTSGPWTYTENRPE